MTTILQFYESDPATDAALIADLTAHFNAASGMDALRATDQSYATPSFAVEAWRKHMNDPLWWTDYGAIYRNLGDAGRAASDALLAYHPAVEVVEVPDLVAAGYAPPLVYPAEPAQD